MLAVMIVAWRASPPCSIRCSWAATTCARPPSATSRLVSLFALGEAVVIIAGGIDLSVGSIICISAVATSYLTMNAGFGIGAAVACAIGLSLVVGLAQGLVITIEARRAAVRGDAGIDAPAARVRRGPDRRHRHRLSVGKFPGCSFPRRGSASACRCPASGSRSAPSRSRRPHAPDAVRALLLRHRLEQRGGESSGVCRCSGSASSPSSPARRPSKRGGDPLRRLPAERHTLARFFLIAASPSPPWCWGLLRLLEADGAPCSACSSAPASCRSPSALVNLVGKSLCAERGRWRGQSGRRHRRPHLRKERLAASSQDEHAAAQTPLSAAPRILVTGASRQGRARRSSPDSSADPSVPRGSPFAPSATTESWRPVRAWRW